VEKGTWYLVVMTRCQYLDTQNRCGIYMDRPKICRDYTTENCEYDEDWTFTKVFEDPKQIWEYAEAILPPRRPKGRAAQGAQGVLHQLGPPPG
jgi:Fe-S-cluster containining protein